jgi:hypothetical protein
VILILLVANSNAVGGVTDADPVRNTAWLSGNITFQASCLPRVQEIRMAPSGLLL